MTKKSYIWLCAYFIIGLIILFGLAHFLEKFAVPYEVAIFFGSLSFLMVSISFGSLVWWVFSEKASIENAKVASTKFLRYFALALSIRLGLFLLITALIIKYEWDYSLYIYIIFLVYFFYSTFFEVIPLLLINKNDHR